MQEFWEAFFSAEGTKWKFEPSDSALYAAELFRKNNIENVLIPGVGYGRNAEPFIEQKIDLSGIEISQSAIAYAREHGYVFPINCGSVTDMPFDKTKYGGIFCYSLLHLLNKAERKKFISDCFHSLLPGGLMVFTVISKEYDLFGQGKYISRDRYKLPIGMKVFFYDELNLSKEFENYPIEEIKKIDEPIKYAEGFDPIKCLMIVCRKSI